MKFRRLNYTEPAVLRGIWVALVALLASVGVTVTDTVQGDVGALIGAVGVVVPIVQGYLTRSAVYSPESVDTITVKDEA